MKLEIQYTNDTATLKTAFNEIYHTCNYWDGDEWGNKFVEKFNLKFNNKRTIELKSQSGIRDNDPFKYIGTCDTDIPQEVVRDLVEKLGVMVIDKRSLWIVYGGRNGMELSCDVEYWENDNILNKHVYNKVNNWGIKEKYVGVYLDTVDKVIQDLRGHINKLVEQQKYKGLQRSNALSLDEIDELNHLDKSDQKNMGRGIYDGGAYTAANTVTIQKNKFKIYVKVDGEFMTVKQAEKYLMAKKNKNTKKKPGTKANK